MRDKIIQAYRHWAEQIHVRQILTYNEAMQITPMQQLAEMARTLMNLPRCMIRSHWVN